jgi:hypothetical protein
MTKTTSKDSLAPLECGLVMPIAAIDGCSPEHWAQVRAFLVEAICEIDEPKFVAKLVSEEADVGMILRRIVQNVYKSEIVVCDVSGKNPNVMFELGMRMAFDKPVVIIKDDQTGYSFDTSIIEHLEYPRDLRYPVMVEFKRRLKAKIEATVQSSRKDGYQGFLKNFGTFTVAHLAEKQGSIEEVLLQNMAELQKSVAAIQRSVPPAQREPTLNSNIVRSADGRAVRVNPDFVRRFLAATDFTDSSDVKDDKAAP